MGAGVAAPIGEHGPAQRQVGELHLPGPVVAGLMEPDVFDPVRGEVDGDPRRIGERHMVLFEVERGGEVIPLGPIIDPVALIGALEND